jgi:tetratricopeptide (TPR) repeat protein
MTWIALAIAIAPVSLPAQTPPPASGSGPSPDAIAQGSPPALPQGTSREGMWPAPTADDWKQPCLVVWQRTFADALAVSKQTRRPILICVNMDGEIASEHYAGIRYRRPETAALYAPYVCVLASVYRHTPRDYDEDGRRIPCPRFGTVTCGEHIAIEPGLFDQYFDGRRIAPRHIMVELDQAEVYDVFYAWDTDTIFTALKTGIANRPAPPPDARGDRPMLERVTSADAEDRILVETAYSQGSREVRRALLEATLRHRDVEEIDLLRLAIFGFDVEMAKLARRALAQGQSEAAVDLIAEALKLPMEDSEREMLLTAVTRLSETYPRARTLAAVYQGLAGKTTIVDISAWTNSAEASAASGTSARGAYESASRLENRLRASESRPSDAAAKLDLAESFLDRASSQAASAGSPGLAGSPGQDRRFAGLLYEDARAAALEAEKLGAKGWRLDAVMAVACAQLDDYDEACRRAESAVTGGMPAPVPEAEGLQETNAVTVLSLFARARQRAIAKAYREKTPWPPEWLTDIDAAYAVLQRHPLGTDAHVAAHFDFLRWLGATTRATDALEQGLARFPDSWVLHDRLRSRILAEKGVLALEPAYAERLAREDASPNLEWFAGYASLVVAEQMRRTNHPDEAREAYDRAVDHYRRSVKRNPGTQASADHYVALAFAGRARVSLEGGDLEAATHEILASFGTKPEAAATLDGLNISPVDTAKMLRARAAEVGNEVVVQRVQEGLDRLDPSLLQLPAYEREVPPVREGRGGRR